MGKEGLGLSYDRITYECPVCHIQGYVKAVWVGLYEVKLEFECRCCGVVTVRDFDRVRIDAWLHGEIESPFASKAIDTY